MNHKRLLVAIGIAAIAVACSSTHKTVATTINTDSLTVRGFAIAAPTPSGVDSFVTFINDELAPRKINVLILRIDYNYQYSSHPELRDSVALSKEEVKKMVAACKAHQ